MRTIRVIAIPTLLLMLSGCIGGKAAQVQALSQKRTFVPQAGSAQPLSQAPRFAAVKVRSFRALPPFDARNFIVRRPGGEFAADFYNGWLVAPADLIRVQVSRYLEEARLFQAVYDPGCGTVTPLGLEGVVSELYLDYAGEVPAAVVTLRLLVLDEQTPSFTVRFTSEKQARVALGSHDQTAAPQAFSRALTQVLEALAGELAQASLNAAAAP